MHTFNPGVLRRAAIIMLSTLLAACADVALQTVNLPSYLLSDLRSERGLDYGDQPHQKLDLYFPAAAADRRQLIVFVYGGAWTSGSRQSYYFVADALTALGYSVAIPDYIKYPAGEFPAFVQDVALSVSWLSRHMQRFADIDDIILMGHSAGAHTAALLLTDPGYLRAYDLSADSIGAFIGLAGPYGFTPKEKKYRNIFANLDDFDQMRPLHFVSGGEPPMLLLHGTGDSTVLPVNTRKFAQRVNAKGGTAATRFYTGDGHIGLVLALSRLPFTNNRVRSDIAEFLHNHAPHGQ